MAHKASDYSAPARKAAAAAQRGDARREAIAAFDPEAAEADRLEREREASPEARRRRAREYDPEACHADRKAVEHAIQCVEEFDSEADAREALAAFSDQHGYLGGRVLAPGPGKPRWRMQAFVTDDGPRDGWLPDGCRRVVIPPGALAALGLK